ncbi:MAG: hypothetical protein ABI177_07580 [Edaphobacter sp.]
MNLSRPARLALPLIAAACLLTAGCARRPYGPPPPPPYRGPSALIQSAEQQGFRGGANDGSRDAYNHMGFHPKRNRIFHDTPGYNPSFGPFGPYRSHFRDAYLRGYSQGFNRR